MSMFRIRAVFSGLCCVTALVLTTACSGNGSTSLSPTGPSSPGSGSGSTIAGQINGGSGLNGVGFSTAAATTSGITVTVTGTGVSTTADGEGRFTLTGVPAGTIQLKFTGPGIDASVEITVGTGEAITIAVTVSGNTATLESQRGSGGNSKTQLEGRITEIDPAAGTIRVAGVLVTVPATAVIRRASGAPLLFADLGLGDRVHVKGARLPEGMEATEVKVQSQNTQPPLTMEGTVMGLTGLCPALTFTLQGTLVSTDGATMFKDGSCAALADGDEVEVKGRVVAGGLLASQVEADDAGEDDDDDDDDDNGGGRGNGPGKNK